MLFIDKKSILNLFLLLFNYIRANKISTKNYIDEKTLFMSNRICISFYHIL